MYGFGFLQLGGAPPSSRVVIFVVLHVTGRDRRMRVHRIRRIKHWSKRQTLTMKGYAIMLRINVK